LSYEAYFGLDETLKTLSKGLEWLESELFRQIAFFSANDEVEKDIYQLGYSLITLLKYKKKITTPIIEKAFSILFGDQKENGIWDHYHPLFHYPEEGNAYCHVFELLRSFFLIPTEYQYILKNYIDNFEKTRKWIKNYEQTKENDYKTYGWCSYHSHWTGPESWATAAVFDYLREYNKMIEQLIVEHIFKDYKTIKTFPEKFWDQLLDCDVFINERTDQVKSILNDKIINQIIEKKDTKAFGILFFGPPATGKTQYAKGIACKLKWPLIILTPSHFLLEGFAGIEKLSTEIFKKLEYLKNVVILFDELDEFIRIRKDSDQYESRLFTTSMLPKIQELHEKHYLIYIFNTNNTYDKIDKAIIRPGRFDFILNIGPPNYDEKLKLIKDIISKGNKLEEAKLKEISDIFDDKKVKIQLFLYFEILELCKEIKNIDFISNPSKISEIIDRQYDSIILNEKKDEFNEYKKNKRESKIYPRK